MQTFLPVADFAESAQMLDYKRLGKQRVEGMQLLNAMQPDYPHKGWLSHPAKIMWEGYENALKEYVNTMITQWKARGYNNTMKLYQIDGPIDCLEGYKGIRLSKETFVKLLELAILSAFIQGLSAFQRSGHIFNSKIKPKDALNVWKNGSVLRGDMLSLLLSFEQKFLSTGVLKGSTKADHFISERIEEFISLKNERNILAHFSPCLFSGISFFLETKDNNIISTIINRQRNIFGGHRV